MQTRNMCNIIQIVAVGGGVGGVGGGVGVVAGGGGAGGVGSGDVVGGGVGDVGGGDVVGGAIIVPWLKLARELAGVERGGLHVFR